MKNKLKQFSKQFIAKVSVVAVALSLALALNYVYAWTGPSASPPGSNVSAPLNVSALTQLKNGPLGVNDFSSFGNAYIQGNLGIGMTSPSQPLHISRSDGDEAKGLRIDNLNLGGYGSAIRIYGKQNFGSNDVLEAGRIQVGGEANWGNAAETDSYMRFHLVNNGTLEEKLRITSAGNVGIGMTSPTAKLDVAGTAKVTGFQLGTSATAGQILTTDASGVGTWQNPADGGGGGGGSTLAAKIGLNPAVPWPEYIVCGGRVFILSGAGPDLATYLGWVPNGQGGTVPRSIDFYGESGNPYNLATSCLFKSIQTLVSDGQTGDF